MSDWGRVLTAIATPFDREGNVDYMKAGELAKHILDNGSDGLVVSGTTGESPTLSHEEKLKLFETIKNAAGDKSVVANTGGNNTAESVKLTKETANIGIDGIMLVNPYYNKPSQEGLYAHFAAIAETVQLPVMVYNIQSRTAVNLETSTLMRLAKISNIKAVKEASGNLSQISDVIAQAPEGFKVYSGDDLLTLPIVAIGGHGVVSVTSHIVGNDIKAMINAYLNGDNKKASELHLKMIPIVKAMFCTVNPTPLKYALTKLGWDMLSVRLPLVEPTEKDKSVVDAALLSYGLL